MIFRVTMSILCFENHLDSNLFLHHDAYMRTTVTLDPETERLLREAMHQRGQSFKETLNQAVTKGLADLLCDADKTSFVQQSFPMGLRTGYDPAHLNSLNDDMEVDAFLDLSHRLNKQSLTG